ALSDLAARLRGQAAAAVGDALADDEDLRATAGNWAADLLDLCAGRLEPEQAMALAGEDAALAARVAAAARRLASLRGGVGGDVAADADGYADDEAEAEAEPAPTSETPAVVARDELDILAEESLALRDELAQADG